MKFSLWLWIISMHWFVKSKQYVVFNVQCKFCSYFYSQRFWLSKWKWLIFFIFLCTLSEVRATPDKTIRNWDPDLKSQLETTAFQSFDNPWAKFHRTAKHTNLLSMTFQTGLLTKFPFVAYCLLLIFSCRLLILKVT